MDPPPPPLPPPPAARIQQVAKASSDQLLRKFAELEDPDKDSPRKLLLIRGPIRRKRPSRRSATTSTTAAAAINSRSLHRSAEAHAMRSTRMAEWKALLPAASRRSSSSLLRRLGGAVEPGVRARDISGIGIILEALEKTWRKTVGGASRMLVERHCNNSHVQLISDAV